MPSLYVPALLWLLSLQGAEFGTEVTGSRYPEKNIRAILSGNWACSTELILSIILQKLLQYVNILVSNIKGLYLPLTHVKRLSIVN